MTVKAQWFEAAAPPAGDPFAGYAEQPMLPKTVEEVGKPIDLSSAEPVLRRRLIELVDEEAHLHAAGVSCAIRDREDTSCCACPMRGKTERIARLCEVGTESEQLLTTLAIHKVRASTGP